MNNHKNIDQGMKEMLIPSLLFNNKTQTKQKLENLEDIKTY